MSAAFLRYRRWSRSHRARRPNETETPERLRFSPSPGAIFAHRNNRNGAIRRTSRSLPHGGSAVLTVTGSLNRSGQKE